MVENKLVDLMGLLHFKIHVKLEQMFSFAFSLGVWDIVIYVQQKEPGQFHANVLEAPLTAGLLPGHTVKSRLFCNCVLSFLLCTIIFPYNSIK